MGNAQTRALAFFLPQFHPIPENDHEWGAGFTEWRNVAAAAPRFRSHYQPHLPRDLGFYDLRLPEIRDQQASLAALYGIAGFVYYHYWFNGRRVLELPVEEIIKAKSPDFPFALCWANEPWTRRWDGGDDEVFIEQTYSPKDDVAHWRFLLSVFEDPRYIRVSGRPLFLVYRASALPDSQSTTARWRAESLSAGKPEPYLVRVEGGGEPKQDPRRLGFDAAVDFAPDFEVAWQPTNLIQEIRRHIEWRLNIYPNRVMDYDYLVARSLARPPASYPRFPGVCPSWDNSPRARRNALILRNSTPERFRQWVAASVAGSPFRGGDDFIFINAWNEWAEGAHLEPDLRFGHAWLQAVRDGLKDGQLRRADSSGGVMANRCANEPTTVRSFGCKTRRGAS